MAKAKKDISAQETQVHWGFWLGFVFFFLVVIAMLSMGWFVSKRVGAEENVPVTSLLITGEMPYTQKQDVMAAIESVHLGNFFKVNVNEVQQRVQDLPWVYSVSVRKQWPNELKVYVVDQRPVALWNGEFFLNEFGKAFQANANRINHHLPAFFGPEGSEKIALENYRNLNEMLSYDVLSIDELVLSERYSWQLTLSDGVRLNLGREERVERVQRFMDVYQEIKDKQQDNKLVDYVDLRYDTGVAVGWKPAPEKERV
ncbi:cell division protein FtsQ/DivIB [Thalassotalea atypica]|uniref:cell division protein FtsQ/DivIB n=1 Tax=Thalassotalea atypica TaxID=2054316 RepID=UPI0025736342|nr:cell division protein FtsQ/DivIB [Thalassotalea atypica]